MKQFALAAPVTILGLNVRSEKHGKAKVPAIDVKCRLTATNYILDQLKGPGFRLGAYGPAEDQQTPLEGVDQATETPLLRLEGIEPIHLQDELTGYSASFDLGIGRKESIVELLGAKVDSFVVELLQGGTVRIEFKLKCARVGKREIGELGILINAEVALRLDPPSAAEQEQAALDLASKKAA